MVEAVESERVLLLMYVDAAGVYTTRYVDPIRLEGIHLFAWCLHREEYRRFVLERAVGMELGPEHHEVLLPLPDPESPEAQHCAWVSKVWYSPRPKEIPMESKLVFPSGYCYTCEDGTRHGCVPGAYDPATDGPHTVLVIRAAGVDVVQAMRSDEVGVVNTYARVCTPEPAA